MGSSKSFRFFVVIVLLVLYDGAFAEDDPPGGFDGDERDALMALKIELNNSFLKHNWTSIMCYLNNTPNWYGVQCSNGRVTEILLENMNLTGKLRVDALFNLTQLSVLSLKNNSIYGRMMDFSYNPRLTRIDLSSNNFHGPISPSVLTLSLLESLQLENNRLNGSIPDLNQSTLKQFNVSNNNLSGEIPNTPVLRSFDASSYNGNRRLCGPPSSTPCSGRSLASGSNGDKPNNSTDTNDDSDKSSWVSRLAAPLIVVNVVGAVVVLFLFMIYCKKSRKLKRDMKRKPLAQDKEENYESKIEMGEKSVVGGEEKVGQLTFMEDVGVFELGDLLKASAEGLGKGNFGNSYKARLDDGRNVVVKRLRDLKPFTSDEFVKELEAIADHKHPNLLPLLAFYYSEGEKLLVYKYAPQGNLYNRLHGGRGTKDRVPFRWNSRLSVARGVARALEYLHRNTKSQSIVPHGNLKSLNVLLDENDMVLVSDYGFASIIALPIAAQRMVSFKSPEYVHAKKVSRKSDVWSYGCLLLELLTGRISSNSAPPDVNGVDLCSWVHRAVREEWTAEIFDLEAAAPRSASHGMLKLLQLAVRCCDKSPERRPEMAQVVQEVDSIKLVVDSEEEDDSLDPSLTDDSMSASERSMSIGGER
ncbi:hypothetical protein RJ640_009045 [Escallonia rubra]|uniref:Protein kinase domain-containing protein n=1 Tax=Escallonia rubra TaxID=112253 RepID=A0AA88UHC0_9ASTE|nr:hypothetical protein RJ640_009045 [Escallonia rubra]